MNEVRTCEQCGAELDSSAPEGLCPRCVLATVGNLRLDDSASEHGSPQQPPQSALHGPTKAGDSPEKTVASPAPDTLTDLTGTTIGRYKLQQQIDEGGFGIVYMAEQLEPVQRKVALKVIKAGMDTREVIARFEAERQALALMDHPNIAQVLDGGATTSGRPYFVMELVRGLPITEYCDQCSLSTRERLELLIKVCRAVQHAHQKGVIHRDLKPSNVLVTLHDGEPVPKVIDFGVAKALGQKLTDKTLFTRFEQMIGTPAYMSPEQAALSGLDIDTRSDIYSLGVLLYELLTGVTPFDSELFRQAGLDEIRRMIAETEPPQPSTRLLTLGERLAEVAKHRHAEPAALTRLVRGDLDWITMKALEKDRHRRYETVNGLAADLERYLKHEPVLARPPSALYRLRKSVQRNRLAFAAAAAVVVALVTGLCAASWALVRERTARREAEAARNLARAEAARNEQVARFLMTTIGPDAWRGEETLVRPILLDFFSQRLGTELTNQPSAQADLWLSIANSCDGAGYYARAVTNCHRALDAYRRVFGDEHVKVALALYHLGMFYRHNKDFSEAQAKGRQAVAVARTCSDPKTLAVCLLDAAKSFNAAGRPTPEAIPLLREAMHLRRRVVPHLLALLDGTRLLVKALEGLASEGRQDEAKAILEEELKEAPIDADLLRLKRTLER